MENGRRYQVSPSGIEFEEELKSALKGKKKIKKAAWWNESKQARETQERGMGTIL